MTMRCGNCKHWTEIPEETVQNDRLYKGVNIKVYSVPKFIDKCFEYCEEETEELEKAGGDLQFHTVHRLLPEFKDLKFFTQDRYTNQADLYTREDFFCAHFEEKVNV